MTWSPFSQLALAPCAALSLSIAMVVVSARCLVQVCSPECRLEVWEVAVVGRNLVEQGHKESNDPLFYQTSAIGVDRAIYGQLTCRF